MYLQYQLKINKSANGVLRDVFVKASYVFKYHTVLRYARKHNFI